MKIETYNKLETIIHNIYELMDVIDSEATQFAMNSK